METTPISVRWPSSQLVGSISNLVSPMRLHASGTLSLSTQPRQYSVPLWRNGWSTKVQAQSGTECNTVIASGTISLSLVPNPTNRLTRGVVTAEHCLSCVESAVWCTVISLASKQCLYDVELFCSFCLEPRLLTLHKHAWKHSIDTRPFPLIEGGWDYLPLWMVEKAAGVTLHLWSVIFIYMWTTAWLLWTV